MCQLFDISGNPSSSHLKLCVMSLCDHFTQWHDQTGTVNMTSDLGPRLPHILGDSGNIRRFSTSWQSTGLGAGHSEINKAGFGGSKKKSFSIFIIF